MSLTTKGGVGAIELMQSRRATVTRTRTRALVGTVVVFVPLIALTLACFFSIAGSAYASRAATGELAFYPCTGCHPVTLGSDGQPTKPLPNGMEKHEIELEAHDILGEGDKACLACHDEPSKNPGKLILPDGSLVDITGDVSRVCQRCHFEKYREFTAGIHGKDAEKCTSSGCHNPHTPSWIYVEALPPFQGTGVEVNAVGPDREAFTPFAGPPVQPPVETPTWLWIVTALGAVWSLAVVGYLTVGRPKR